jgi:hypothetical protein
MTSDRVGCWLPPTLTLPRKGGREAGKQELSTFSQDRRRVRRERGIFGRALTVMIKALV